MQIINHNLLNDSIRINCYLNFIKSKSFTITFEIFGNVVNACEKKYLYIIFRSLGDLLKFL